MKPLYYAEVGDVVVFASELKAVLASGIVPIELDYDAIDAYLALGFVPGPLTPLRGGAQAAPGASAGGRRSRCPRRAVLVVSQPVAAASSRSDEEWADLLLEQLEDAITSRLMSDVPLGAMLSGGLDSSLVVALMARQMGQPVKTFTVGFAGTADSELGGAGGRAHVRDRPPRARALPL